jgi:Hexokinase.
MDFSIVTVGVDGSVYRYHPYFHHMMLEKIPALISHSKKVNLVLSEVSEAHLQFYTVSAIWLISNINMYF